MLSSVGSMKWCFLLMSATTGFSICENATQMYAGLKQGHGSMIFSNGSMLLAMIATRVFTFCKTAA